MTDLQSMPNDDKYVGLAWARSWGHFVPWLVVVAFVLLVTGASISSLSWNLQGLAGWALGWMAVSAAWAVLSSVWKASWPLLGYGMVASAAAAVLLWAQPAFSSLACSLWLAAAGMTLWGCAAQPGLRPWGVMLSLAQVVVALLLAVIRDWPQSGLSAPVYQVGAMVAAVACHAGLALIALQHQKLQSVQNVVQLQRQCLTLKQEVAEQRAVAHNDALTGAESLPRITEFIHQLRERHARKAETFCVALVEMDPWGCDSAAEAGQKLQIMLGSLLGAQIRTVDRLGRHHRDGFLLVLPDTSSIQAVWVLHRIRSSMRYGQWEELKIPGALRHPTLTIAVAEYLKGETADQMLARVDMALLHGRTMGHDQIVVAEDLNF